MMRPEWGSLLIAQGAASLYPGLCAHRAFSPHCLRLLPCIFLLSHLCYTGLELMPNGIERAESLFGEQLRDLHMPTASTLWRI